MITISKKLRCCCSSLYRADAVRYGMMMLLLVGGLLLATHPAAAQSPTACFADAGGLPGNIPCTANDVQTVATIEAVNDTCTSRADTIDLSITVTWAANANRYDIGLFVAEDGGNAKTGECFQAVGTIPPFTDLDTATPGDTCGDIPGHTQVTQTTFFVTVSCSAADSDNHLLVPACRTWKQPGANLFCDDIGDTAGTGSKCDCSAFTTDIVVPPDPCAGVDCSSLDDQCNNGVCDPTKEGTGIQLCVAQPKTDGTTCDDGDACTQTDTCVSGTCTGSNPVVCTALDTCHVAGTCDPQTGICSNPAAQEGTTCGSSAFGPCDNPDTCDASGNCLDNHVADGTGCGDVAGACTNADVCEEGACVDGGYKAPGTACGSTADTACDNPDTCDGSGTCLPNYETAGTVCRASTGDCDAAEVCDASGVCPADTGTQCNFRNDPQITPTATTCQQYTSNTSQNLDTLLYQLKGQTINSVSPGVFFLYDGLNLSSGDITVTETSANEHWARFIDVLQGQVTLYDLDCNKLTVGSVDLSTPGLVKISGVSPGSYILGIKYDPGSLVGFNPPSISSTYTFAVDAGGASSGSDSLLVTKKPNKP